MWHDIRLNGPQNRREAKFSERFVVENNLLYYTTNNERRLVIPPRKLSLVISAYHDSKDAAHPGIDETIRAIREYYYFRNLPKRVGKYVNNCLVCHAVKSRQVQSRAPLRPHLSNNPFESISIDILGPYPTSRLGNRFIVVVEDTFSKWVEAKATQEAGAEQVNEFLETEIFPRFGSCKYIISDNGPAFISNAYEQMCNRHNIKPVYTAVYMQRENPVERKVAEFKKVLRALQYTKYPRNRWDEYIPQALSILRTRKNRATGETPAKALLGYEIAKPGQWDIPEYVRKRQADNRDAAHRRRVIRVRQLDFQEKTYPQAHEGPPVTFRRGDKVMIKELVTADPFAPAWSGPHVISKRKSAEIYDIDKNGRKFQYHVDQLRPAPPGNPPVADEPPVEPPAPPRPRPPPRPRVPSRPPSTASADSSDNEDQGPPVKIVTTAQVHVAPPGEREARPADTGMEEDPLPPSGKSAPSSSLRREDGSTNAAKSSARTAPITLPAPNYNRSSGATKSGRRTPSEFDEPGPIYLTRPRTWGRRRRSLHPPVSSVEEPRK